MRFVGECLDTATSVKSTPEEKAEAVKSLRSHTFGFGYETDDNGEPVDKSPLSDWAISNGKAPRDSLSQHLFYVKKVEKGRAARTEAKRIKGLDKAGKYTEQLKQYLALPDDPITSIQVASI